MSGRAKKMIIHKNCHFFNVSLVRNNEFITFAKRSACVPMPSWGQKSRLTFGLHYFQKK